LQFSLRATNHEYAKILPNITKQPDKTIKQLILYEINTNLIAREMGDIVGIANKFYEKFCLLLKHFLHNVSPQLWVVRIFLSKCGLNNNIGKGAK